MFLSVWRWRARVLTRERLLLARSTIQVYSCITSYESVAHFQSNRTTDCHDDYFHPLSTDKAPKDWNSLPFEFEDTNFLSIF